MIDFAILGVALLFFAFKRLLSWLRFFQQDEYDNGRFIQWWLGNKLFDQKATVALLIILAFSFALPWIVWLYVAALMLVLRGFKEADPTQTGKKKLVLTQRAKRILALALFSLLIATSSLSFITDMNMRIGTAILIIQLLPLCLVIGNTLLKPWEMFVQKRYWNEAHDKILKLKPTVIGITGSFGKTSVKHILGHILNTHATTLITPGSVNTPMGIARIVRERLTPDHRFFIAEMGAYGPGSIKRLCDLTPPNVAVITAIGHAHYERFKSLDTVAKTKFELAEAARENNGPVIFNGDICRFKDVINSQHRCYKSENWVGCKLTADSTQELPHDANWDVQNINQTSKGLKVTTLVEGKKHVLEAPIFGLHQAGNMVLAAATAQNLGVPLSHIKTALKSTPQIPHRHEVKIQANGSIIIDNGYNSNPGGFKLGLELLSLLKPKGGRRILITPGMIELGDKHDEIHADVGAFAAKHADIVLAISSDRIPSFTDAYVNAGKGELLNLATFAEAQAWLQKNMQKTDVVLIENDLPDLFEQLPKF
jgi:UDP-N-acetylmuramoyl-tripeptide--D-alanyl-D-alanine ligase